MTTSEDIALGHTQLLRVERGWRDPKQVIDLRPACHHKEERSCRRLASGRKSNRSSPLDSQITMNSPTSGRPANSQRDLWLTQNGEFPCLHRVQNDSKQTACPSSATAGREASQAGRSGFPALSQKPW